MDGWRHASWRVMAMLALIGGLLLVIVACGGDEEDATPAPTAAAVDAAAIADEVAARLEQTMMEVTTSIGAALAEAAGEQPEPLSQADIERIVRAAVPTPAPTAASYGYARVDDGAGAGGFEGCGSYAADGDSGYVAEEGRIWGRHTHSPGIRLSDWESPGDLRI